jgi:cytochrome c peroxidase
MKHFLFFIPLTAFLVAFFQNDSNSKTAAIVKEKYLYNCKKFTEACAQLQQIISNGNEGEIQLAFLATRHFYKKIEPITAYFSPFYAEKLNGAPIPFFEESEADVPVNTPYGMQVMEGFIFPTYDAENKITLQFQADELLRQAQALEQMNTTVAITDATIFDAIMEALYRLAALGITGFDTQTAQNALPECSATLDGISDYLSCYSSIIDDEIAGSHDLVHNKIISAKEYLLVNKNFNDFNRMEFLLQYLNPITEKIATIKKNNGFGESNAGLYYSTILKNTTLFDSGIFNTNKFLDDFKTSPQKIQLGRMLFFEKNLSADNSRSCASCHQPNKAFTDGLPTALAINGHSNLPRNTPTIWNAALQRNLFADSRSRNLEEQVMQVLNNSFEMNGNAQKAAERIIINENYRAIYALAYPSTTLQSAAQNICNAIACYQRTLVSLNSRFDKHMRGVPQLNKKEINGFNIFMGKAKCGTCHFMPLFSGAKPPRYYYIESEVIGVPQNNNKKNAVLDKDSGRYNYTGYPIHLYSFKTPSVRNAAVTAPYMHNGVYTTLHEVVEFYNNGGGKGLGIAPTNQSLPFEKLQLTKKEKKDLVAFIQCLTDTSGSY